MNLRWIESRSTRWAGGGLLLAALLCGDASLRACPFCTAVSQTFSEEMDSLEAAVLARLTQSPPPRRDGDDEAYAELGASKFEVVKVLKGDTWVHPGQEIATHYYGQPDPSQTYLIMGTDSPEMIWTSPLPLSDRGRDYIEQVVTLPAGPERLRFFQDYLEDEDEMLARDAYDEFAKAPYADVLKLKDAMDRERVLKWVQDTQNVPASRRRLYLTMLGVCGQPEDAQLLESYMRSAAREDKLGLDALIACYLTLRGVDGMPTIRELYLSKPDAEYADTYSAIMAMRFHGSETEIIPREELLAGFRCLLDRPDLADLVIPDLARWEDWTVMPRLVDLYEQADTESNWIRVPIINYVRACPLESAQTTMQQLQRIDPQAVKRASMFFPFAPVASVASSGGGSPGAGEAGTDQSVAVTAPVPPPEIEDPPAASGGGLLSPPRRWVGSLTFLAVLAVAWCGMWRFANRHASPF